MRANAELNCKILKDEITLFEIKSFYSVSKKNPDSNRKFLYDYFDIRST